MTRPERLTGSNDTTALRQKVRSPKLVTSGVLLGIASAISAPALAGDVLVYIGEGGVSEGYTNFGAAVGKTIVSQAVLPADLSPFDCVVLPANGPGFSPATTAALTGYANGGGRIVAAAEWSAFPSPISAMNGLASALGSGMSVNPAALSCNFHTTMNIDPSSFTDGVTSLVMACSSEVVVSGTAESLFRSANEGVPMAGAEQIGSGWLFLLGDSNVLSDASDNGYTEHDNGVLAANFCGEITDAEIMKDYRHADVCFEQDNDLDGLFDEDPVDDIDNDGDGQIDEDTAECPDGEGDGLPNTSLGTLLPPVGADGFLVEAVVKRKDDTVSSYNPGQYYAVSKVEVLEDVETLTITEDFGNCTLDEGLSALNPPAGRGGGSVAIVEVDADGVAAQIANAKSPNVQVTDEAVVATLDDVPAGSTILMYVKFGPGLKGEVFPGSASCENETTVETANTLASDTATLHVLEK